MKHKYSCVSWMISKTLVDHEIDFCDQQRRLLLEGEHQEALENLTSLCDVEQAGSAFARNLDFRAKRLDFCSA